MRNLVIVSLLLLAMTVAGCRTRLAEDPFSSSQPDLSRSQDQPDRPCAGLRSASGWAVNHGDARHTGRSTRVSARSAQLRFSYDAGLAFNSFSSPTIGDDGTVYFCTDLDELHAVDGATGALRWKYSAKGCRSSAAIGPDGTVYLAAGRFVLALDATDGRERWRANRVGDRSVAVGRDGTVYEGYQALDGATGAVKWSTRIDNTSAGEPAIGDDCTVYFASEGLNAVDGPTGTLRWSVWIGGAGTWTSPVVGDDGVVYLGTSSDAMQGIDGVSGTVLWTRRTVAQPMASAAVGFDGLVYLIEDDAVVAVEGRSGDERWRFRSPGSKSAPVVGGDRTVYVSSGDGVLHAIDGLTGAERWQAQLATEYHAAPAIGPDGTLYVVARDGKTIRLLALAP